MSKTQSLTPLAAYLPSRNEILERDRALFDRTLRTFVPPGAFDAAAWDSVV